MGSEEILQLCARARQGSVSAREKLVKAHTGLVIHVAKGFYHPGAFLEWEDLMQQGCLGLLRAIEKFNPRRQSRGKLVRFATYAHYWVLHFISREIENHGRTVAVPIGRLKKRPADSSEFSVLPLDSEWVEDESGTALARWVDLDDHAENWGRAWDARRRVERLLRSVSQRQRQILQYRYGLSGVARPLNQKEAGKKMNLTASRLGVLERSALHQLREAASF